MDKWQRFNYNIGLPIGPDGRRITDSPAHIELSKNAAKEGMVLLKNEAETLPLASGTKLAVFGKACVDYVKGGGGSGDVTVRYTTSLYEGLKTMEGGPKLYTPLYDFYRADIDKQYADKKEPGMTVEPELSDEMVKGAREFTDTAIITICRFSGEGWDRRSKTEIAKDKAEGKEKAELFEDGDFYLSHAERAMVEKVKTAFPRVIVVMNVGGMVDTQWFAFDSAISAVLIAWQGGMEGGRAAAELLFGQGNPSGKLTDTFARELEDYPSTEGFHESEAYVNYTDDIFVGYRYFETIPGAAEKVVYPFGFGLSYTSFEYEVKSAVEGDGVVSILVNVANTGKYAGREVIQAYVSAPAGKLTKPARELKGFAKTALLAPGEEEELVINIPVASMASYDDLGAVADAAYVLEEGYYSFYVGNSVRAAEKIDFEYHVRENRIVEQLSHRMVPGNLPRRMLADGTYMEVPMEPETRDLNKSEIGRTPDEEVQGYEPAVKFRRGRHLFWGEPDRITEHMLIEVAEGKMTLEEFMAQLSDEEMADLLGGQPNNGVSNTWCMGNQPKYGIPNMPTADGPAGLRIGKECGVTTTAFPCSTLMACTFDPELIEEVGAAGASEVKENNIGVWLTPAINIHRSPLCGRNFEYYSEDPFVAGTCATAMVKGIQSQNIGASVKHFCVNNKEVNRNHSDSRVSERALREIYLKGFEMAVKGAKPWTIMSSYNACNGVRTSENKDLLTGILREEWGFDGCVTTDWWCNGEQYREILAGNDIKMPIGETRMILEALNKGVITRADLERCAGNVLRLILKCD